MPDDKLGWLMLDATGGHPGQGDDHAVIRRFTVPADGKVVIDGQLKHDESQGNGVRGRIVSSRHGELASYSVHKSQAVTKLENIRYLTGFTGSAALLLVLPGELRAKFFVVIYFTVKHNNNRAIDV